MDSGGIVDELIDPDALASLERTYNEQVARGNPSAVAIYSYAHGLIKSNNRNVRKGIKLLEDLLRKEVEDISKRDYVYYLAIAHTRLKEYDRALAYVDILLSAESNNRQALDLKDLIQHRMKKDGIIGMAILGGGIAVIGGLAIAAFAASKRSSHS
ncbi:fis1-related protein, putative [Brugia malayi]|uniref:Mitochondrial fission 1 protein n=2 Tax=Brugia TaxID=6278 RepID=A0A0H5S2I6_BRUMA|nr:fis1-related protein, putative [Brugia malayi]CRZ22424.1 Bm8538 [Brugia malayi]VIO99754.1 fis1-related protein, putative [Brugia malayi]